MTDGTDSDPTRETSGSESEPEDRESSDGIGDDESDAAPDREQQSTKMGTGFTLPSPGEDSESSDSSDDEGNADQKSSLSSRLRSLTSSSESDSEDTASDGDDESGDGDGSATTDEATADQQLPPESSSSAALEDDTDDPAPDDAEGDEPEVAGPGRDVVPKPGDDADPSDDEEIPDTQEVPDAVLPETDSDEEPSTSDEAEDDEFADPDAPTDMLDPDELPERFDEFEKQWEEGGPDEDDDGGDPAPTDRLEEVPFEVEPTDESAPSDPPLNETGDTAGPDQSGAGGLAGPTAAEHTEPTGIETSSSPEDDDEQPRSTRMLHAQDPSSTDDPDGPTSDSDQTQQPAGDSQPSGESEEQRPGLAGDSDQRETRMAHGGPLEDSEPTTDDRRDCSEDLREPRNGSPTSAEASGSPAIDETADPGPTDSGDHRTDDDFLDEESDGQWELDEVDDSSDGEIDDFFDDEPIEGGLLESTDAASPPPPEQHDGNTAPSPGSDPAGDETGTPAEPPQQRDEPSSPAGDDQSPGQQPDEEFTAQDTQLFQSSFENEPLCPRLSALEGPAAGQEFLVDGMRNSVGRATDNSVVVPDLSMSRRHFEIVQNPDDSYEIHDLMAVNGTALNGVDIKEAGLRHGDRIEAGQTVFQFLVPGDAPAESRDRHLVPAADNKATTGGEATEEMDDRRAPDDPGPSPGTLDKLLLVVTIVAGLLCIPLVAFLIHAVVLDAPEQEANTAAELYFEGVDALQEGRWDRAEQLFEKSYRTDSDFGEAQAQIERIEDERQARSILETARNQIDDGLPDELRDQLRSISRESYYYEDAQDLLSQARSNEAQRLFDRAQQAYEDDDFEEALRTLDELEAIAPRHEQADRLRSDVEERMAQDDEADADDQPRARRRAARPSPETAEETGEESALDDPFDETTDPSDRPEADGPVEINFTEGFSKYQDREFEAAIEHFETIAAASRGAIASRAGETAEDIETFHTSLTSGHQARQEGRYDEAIEAFRNARQADEAVAGGGGSFENEIAEQMATTLAERADELLEAGDYSAAYDQYERARAHAPSHHQVQQLGEDLADRANSLYIQAVNQQKSDPEGAADLGQTILTMVPTDHELHERARSLLEQLD